MPRPLLRQVLAATYHQVWWPPTDEIRFDGDHLPVWDEATKTYLDPSTGEVLSTWDGALDAIGPDDVPRHVARFGPTFDAQGVLAGSKDANRCIGYLTKYLTKQVAECHTPGTDPQRAHADPLADALRYEPCSPTCANWLRYGIQPKNAQASLTPGACKGKAHRREHCGYAGRRVLISRKWSGKTLADHRADRKAWLTETLGLEPPTPPATPGTGRTLRPRPSAPRPAAAARRRRPRSLARRPGRSQTQSPGPGRQSFGKGEGGMTKRQPRPERLLTVGEAAELLGTTERFPRRLIAERRIRFVRLGRHVRIPESALAEFIAAGLVEPIARIGGPGYGQQDRSSPPVRRCPRAEVRPMAGSLSGPGRDHAPGRPHVPDQDRRGSVADPQRGRNPQ